MGPVPGGMTLGSTRDVGPIGATGPRLVNVTITSAEVTRDLSQATVWYSVLGDEQEIKQAQEGLASAMGFVRREMGAQLQLRHTPELIFKRDDSWERGSRIDDLLEQIALEREE